MYFPFITSVYCRSRHQTNCQVNMSSDDNNFPDLMELKAIDYLPGYMKVCYLVLFNTVADIAYNVLKEQGINVIPYLKKSVIKLNFEFLN